MFPKPFWGRNVWHLPKGGYCTLFLKEEKEWTRLKGKAMAFQVEEIHAKVKSQKKACAWGNIKTTSVKVCSERYISKKQIWRHSKG